MTTNKKAFKAIIITITMLKNKKDLEELCKDKDVIIMVPTAGPRFDKYRAKAAVIAEKKATCNYEGLNLPYIVSGAIKKDDKYLPNERMISLLENYGVSKEAIFEEHSSHNTAENLYETVKFAKEMNIKDIAISTGTSHYLRFKVDLKHLKSLGLVNKDTKIYPIPISYKGAKVEYNLKREARNVLALAKAIFLDCHNYKFSTNAS